MTRRPLSLAALTVLELSPPDMVSCAAEAGYSHVGLRLIPATDGEICWPMVGDTPLVREVDARLAATGIAALDVEIFRLKPETRVADYAAALDTAALLRARHVLVAGNDPEESRLTANFAALCELGAPLRLTFDLEPMPWTDVRTLQQAARIVEKAARDNGGVLIDPIHFDRAGNVAADIFVVPSQRFHYAQLCDAPEERPADTETLLYQARAERLMPGDGGLDLKGILRALPASIPLALEIPMHQLLRSSSAVERTRCMRTKAEALLSAL